MVTRADAIARRGGAWVPYVRIESLGGYKSLGVLKQYTFCSVAPPAYAATDPTWLPYLGELPTTLGERVNPLGGVKDVGQFTFSLEDRGGFLTDLLRWDEAAVARLSGNFAVGSTTMSYPFGTQYGIFGTYPIVYIGTEAVEVLSSTSLSAIVNRGVLGTQAAPHFTNDPFKIHPPRLERRVVSLGIVPYDAGGPSDELELEQFVIDKVGFSDDWTAYTFECSTRLAILLRTVGAASAGSYQIFSIIQGQILILRAILHPASTLGGVWPDRNTGVGLEDRYFLIDEKEFITANSRPIPGENIPNSATHSHVQITDRARLGTAQVKLDSTAVQNALSVTTPLVADRSDGIGSFRYSPAPTPSTSRASGTWTQSDHFVDIMLCLMLSSATEDDQLELVNYSAGLPNHSCLEVGWGAGIQAARVNVQTFLDVKDRTPDWRFPAFILDASQNLADVINAHFLVPLGCFLTTKSGLLTLTLPRLSYTGQVVSGLDSTNILREKIAQGVYGPRIKAGYDPTNQAKAILLTMTAPNGDTAERLITGSDFAGQYAQYNPAQDQNALIKIAVPGVRADQAGTAALLEQIAMARLLRAFYPPRLTEVYADLATYGIGLGDVIQVTNPIVPNPVTGVRGVVSLGFVVERSTNLDVESDDPGFKIVMLEYGPFLAVGCIAPAGEVTAYSWAGGALGPTLTITRNRYTEASAGGGLPTTDADAFRVGMRVRLVNRDGTLASPSSGAGQTQTITLITSSTQAIRLDGDFNGMGSSIVGHILELADYDQALAQDQLYYSAEADASNMTVGSGTRAPWLWGES